MAKNREVAETDALISVTRTVLGRQTSETKRIKIRPFVTDTARVSVKYGATVPTVEYGSARVDIMLSVPCYIEEIAPVYKQIRDVVDKLVDKEVARFEGKGQDA